jgi:Ca2+/H+ antiporter
MLPKKGAGRRIVLLIPGEGTFTLALLSAMAALVFKETLLAHLGNHWLMGITFLWLFGVILGSAFAVVRHAEALAEWYGEPYGTLILTLSAVCIEVIMISAMMLHGDPDPTMARDTIYATLMIIVNGLIGLAQLLGGLRYGEQHYNLKSSTAYFSMILALLGLGLFVPNFVPAASRTGYGLFLACAAVLLYILFLRIQTFEHRYYNTSHLRAAAGPTGSTVPPSWAGGSGFTTASCSSRPSPSSLTWRNSSPSSWTRGSTSWDCRPKSDLCWWPCSSFRRRASRRSAPGSPTTCSGS